MLLLCVCNTGNSILVDYIAILLAYNFFRHTLVGNYVISILKFAMLAKLTACFGFAVKAICSINERLAQTIGFSVNGNRSLARAL